MNIAFSALVIAILVLPGTLFSRFSHPDRQFLQQRGLAEDLVQGILLSTILHLFWLPLFSWMGSYWGLTVSIRNAIKLAAGPIGGGATDFEHAITDVSAHPWPVATYFTSLYVAAICGGCLAAKLLRRSEAWETGEFFHELFGHGEALRTKRAWDIDLGKEYAISGRIFTAIVCLDKTPYLYYGKLGKDAIKFDASGTPDRFVLSGAMRRKLDEGDEAFQEIASLNFILRFSEIITMGVTTIATPQAAVAAREEQSPPN